MDDSDPSNIDRVGHRLWCLSRGLGVVGFGRHGNYSAMYVQGGGGRGGGADPVAYPPAGHVPVGYFGPRHAWSVDTGAAPDLEEIEVEVRPLSELYVPGKPLDLDHLGVSGTTLVFRPVGVSVRDGDAYLVRIGEGRRSSRRDLRYLVEFVDPALRAARASDG